MVIIQIFCLFYSLFVSSILPSWPSFPFFISFVMFEFISFLRSSVAKHFFCDLYLPSDMPGPSFTSDDIVSYPILVLELSEIFLGVLS